MTETTQEQRDSVRAALDNPEYVEFSGSHILTIEKMLSDVERLARLENAICDLPDTLRNAAQMCRESQFGPNEDMARGFEKSAEAVERAIARAPAGERKVAPDDVKRLPEEWRGSAEELNRLDGEYSQPAITKRRCADELKSALSSAPADGWKLVPVEPTEVMIDAGCPKDPHMAQETEDVYRAMISAAPTYGRE